MQSSKKNESSHPNNSVSAERIEEYKGIQISMPRVEESEHVNEESEEEQKDGASSSLSASPGIRENNVESVQSKPSASPPSSELGRSDSSSIVNS